MMVDWARRLSAEEKRCRPNVVYKKIREEVMKEAEALCQKPSRSLLLALMDLVEVLGGNEFRSVVTVDRASLKHVLLIYGNYTMYYLPNEELMNHRKKLTVIPVVTQYSEKHNLVRYNARRSMVGTYSVVIPRRENDSRRSYFVPEVLFTLGVKSLKLLREIAGNMFDFWDMTLEMPTHIRALAPSFRKMQSCLLLTSEAGSPGGNLSRFQYDKGCGEARLVHFRRSSKVLDGKRGNLLPIVALRKDKDNMRELYVSTTLGFYRALKLSCVKGNRELMSCWNETLQDLGRDTFISGRKLCQDIQQSALTAFTKRVNPGAWCNGFPRHVASKISNPMMIEVVELSIALMEGRILSVFPVEELVYCPIERVRDHLRFRRRNASDPQFRAVVRNKHVGLISAQMREGRMSLADMVTLYGKKKMKEHSGDTACKAGDAHATAPCRHQQDSENLLKKLQLPGESTLLLSDPWLNGDEEQREPMCTLLRLDETLLNRAHSGILGEWVANNHGVVITLSKLDLRDQLSAALIDHLDSLSTERWTEKALMAFPDKAERRLSNAAPRGEASTFFAHRAASSAVSELKKSRSGAERLKRRRYHPGGEKCQAGSWKSDP
ncbi:hypothetical protein Q5P01_010533 [Channa striata]|uniref:Uncharacterized protein n=1 Tax=Channa striata TaxID=64152 RepID=A0AA88MY63_CHASR|nr:hypothetical protein Q5P01_010533 [Channa striata]